MPSLVLYFSRAIEAVKRSLLGHCPHGRVSNEAQAGGVAGLASRGPTMHEKTSHPLPVQNARPSGYAIAPPPSTMLIQRSGDPRGPLTSAAPP